MDEPRGTDQSQSLLHGCWEQKPRAGRSPAESRPLHLRRVQAQGGGSVFGTGAVLGPEGRWNKPGPVRPQEVLGCKGGRGQGQVSVLPGSRAHRSLGGLQGGEEGGIWLSEEQWEGRKLTGLE